MVKRYDTLRKQIRALAAKWEPLIDMPHMTITHKFNETEHACNYAQTRVQPEYRAAVVEWFLPNCMDLEASDVEETLVHELAHIITSPTLVDSKDTKSAVQRRELMTENVSRALLKVLRSRT